MAENNNDQLLQAKARLAEFLKKQKMRRTPERLAILEKAYSTGKHFFADELYGILENDGYHVSRSTLYASLQVLVDAGLLLRHQFGNQPAQYERATLGGKEPHLHLVCTSCGRRNNFPQVPALPALPFLPLRLRHLFEMPAQAAPTGHPRKHPQTIVRISSYHINC